MKDDGMLPNVYQQALWGKNVACGVCRFCGINTPTWPISVCQSDVPEC